MKITQIQAGLYTGGKKKTFEKKNIYISPEQTHTEHIT